MVVQLQGQGNVQKRPHWSLKIHSGASACDLMQAFYSYSLGSCTLPNYQSRVFFPSIFPKHHPPSSNNNIIYLNSAWWITKHFSLQYLLILAKSPQGRFYRPEDCLLFRCLRCIDQVCVYPQFLSILIPILPSFTSVISDYGVVIFLSVLIRKALHLCNDFQLP